MSLTIVADGVVRSSSRSARRVKRRVGRRERVFDFGSIQWRNQEITMNASDLPWSEGRRGDGAQSGCGDEGNGSAGIGQGELEWRRLQTHKNQAPTSN